MRCLGVIRAGNWTIRTVRAQWLRVPDGKTVADDRTAAAGQKADTGR
jgi:hypothetical protein